MSDNSNRLIDAFEKNSTYTKMHVTYKSNVYV